MDPNLEDPPKTPSLSEENIDNEFIVPGKKM